MDTKARCTIGLSAATILLTTATSFAAPAAKDAKEREATTQIVEARKLSDAFVSVAEKAGSSVVQIEVRAKDEHADLLVRWLGRGGTDSPVVKGAGSGVILDDDGAILTNNHVINDALSMSVRLKDGRVFPAKLVGRDPSTDLAVLKIDAQNLTPAKFADSDAASVGAWVVAIGSPFGLGNSVTVGVLSAKGRGGFGMNVIEDYLQTDASINPGNSGGPLCDLEGRVLGINTMIVGRGSGIGFAVPSNLARRVAEQLQKTGKVERPWMGITFQDLDPELATALKTEPRGVLVTQVMDGSPGQKANLKPGDVIASMGGKPLASGHEYLRELIARDVGSNVPLEIVRDGKRYATSVTLTARKEPPVPPLPAEQRASTPGLGMSVRDLAPAEAQQRGLNARPIAIITAIVPGSSADRAGLKVGDVVVESDGVLEPSSQELQDTAKDGQALVRVRRGEAAFYAALKR